MNRKFTTRRDFLKSTIVAAVAAPLLQAEPLPRAGVSSFALDEVTIGELRKELETGKFTARKLAELYLERIKQIDKSGPTLNSVIELNPDATAIADQLDAERRTKKVRGRYMGSQCSSRTTSPPPTRCRPPPVHWRSWGRNHRRILSSPHGFARQAR
jgi:hypothetical protein